MGGRKYYSCPLASSLKAHALFGYLGAIQGGMVAPPADPSPPYLVACRIFMLAAMPKIKPKKDAEFPVSMIKEDA